MTQQVLALKWRPRTFSEVIGQPHVVQALSNGLDNDRLHHAFLFTGTRGVGKTTLARIFAKSLNCEKGVSSHPCGECSVCREVDEGRFVDLIEIDAASRTRVEDTREILDNVQYAPTRGRYKIYLIDEVHMLSNSSFNALLKTLEEPPSHVKFLLATTDPQKLPVTVLSRCLRFQLKRIQDQEIAGQLETILVSENIPFDAEAIKLIAKAGDGSMRDALSLLDQAIAYSGQNVQFNSTHEMLGLIDTQYLVRILQALVTKESHQLLLALSFLKSHGLDYYRFLEDLIDAFHLLTMIQLSPEMGEHENRELIALANQFTAEDLQLFYQIALNGRKDLHNHPNAEVGFEMTLLRMVLFAPSAPIGVATTQKKSQVIDSSSAIFPSSFSSVSPVEDKLQERAIPEDQSVKVEIESEKLEIAEVKSDNGSGEVLVEKSTSIIDDSISNEGLEILPWDDQETSSPEAFTSLPDIPDDDRLEEIATDDDMLSAEAIMSEPPVFEITETAMEEISDSSLGAVSHDENRLEDSEYLISKENALSDNFSVDLEVGIESEPSHDEDPFMGSDIRSEIVVDRTSIASKLNNNEEWLSLVSGLTLESVLLGIAHSLVFKSFDGENLILQRPLSVKDFRIDEAEMRLAMAISASLGVNISCKIEYVETLSFENLHERTERLDEERLQQALSSFKQDEVVQYMEQELGAVLLTKTLKPFDE